MDTISISALVSLPEPTQAQPNTMPLAQSVNSLSFGAVLAASTQPTKELEATISVDAPAIGATPHVNKLTVPPHVMVEAVVAAINVAISLAALKRTTEELATNTGSPQGDDNARDQDPSESHDLEHKLQGLSEAAAIVVTAHHDAPILNATLQTSDEHIPNIVTDKIAKTIEREPAYADLSNHQNLAPLITIGSDADHASPKLHHEKHKINSGDIQKPLHDLVPDIGSDLHRAGTETQEATKLTVPNAFPEVASLRDPVKEAEKIVAVPERNLVIAPNTNNDKTHTDNSTYGLAPSLTQKAATPHIFDVKPTDATTQSVLSDSRRHETSITSNSDKVVMPTSGEIMAISNDYKPNQRAPATAEPQIFRIVDATIKNHSSDENADAAASFKTSDADTDRNQNGSITKNPSFNLNELSDQVPNIELNDDQKIALRNDAKRPTERQIVESTNLDKPLSSNVIQTTDTDPMIRASLEQVAAATESLIEISKARPATTPDPVPNLKISDANIHQTMRSFADGPSFSQEIAGPPSDSSIASKKVSSDIAPAASPPTYVPDFSIKKTYTSTVRLPHATDLIVSSTAYIAPTKSEQVDDRQLNDANAKISAASTIDSTSEADEGLNEPDETLARARSNDGKQINDSAPRPQKPAQTTNIENLGLLRADKTPTIQAAIQPASLDSSPDKHDSRPRQISEDIRLRALERQVVTAAREGANQIRMQLYPPGMGQVLIRLALDGSKLRLQFKTSSSEATSSLQDVEDALRSALGDSGFTITSFDVSDDESEARDERRRNRNVVTPAARQHETSPFSFELQA